MLIGLNGRKQAGKDTVFARACHIIGDVLEVERVSFADLLYRSAAASIGVTVEFLQEFKSDPRAGIRVYFPTYDGDEVIRKDISLREYLQRFGDEGHRRVFGMDFWLDQLDLTAHDDKIVTVTDVRYPNEALAVRAAGGIIVEVIGPEGRVTDDGHASETPLPPELIDFTIDNRVRDDGFEMLDRHVNNLLRGLLRHDKLTELTRLSERVEGGYR